nr:MAG TPA: hypothetical protein [Bacteriophage sp.]
MSLTASSSFDESRTGRPALVIIRRIVYKDLL